MGSCELSAVIALSSSVISLGFCGVALVRLSNVVHLGSLGFFVVVCYFVWCAVGAVVSGTQPQPAGE